MRKLHLLFIAAVLFAHDVAAEVGNAGSAIENVQNYSASPFWSPSSPYNQRFPVQVYVKGPELTAAECQFAVNSAIWTQCSFRNNCAGLSAEDIRPGVMMELSTRNDANYGSACAGYVDAAFAQYRQQAAGMVYVSGFPTSGFRPGNNNAAVEITNPFTYNNQVPYYELEQDMRRDQLRSMQRQTTPPAGITATQMPTAFEDLSFTERMDHIRDGWQHPKVGGTSFNQITRLEDDQEMLQRQQNETTLRKNVLRQAGGIKAYCEEDPYRDGCSGFYKSTDRTKWAALYPGEAQKEIEDANRQNQGGGGSVRVEIPGGGKVEIETPPAETNPHPVGSRNWENWFIVRGLPVPKI